MLTKASDFCPSPAACPHSYPPHAGRFNLARPLITAALASILFLHLTLSAQPQPTGSNVVLVVQGPVHFARSGTDTWLPAQPGQLLQPGDQIRTERRSRAEIRLANGSILPINASSSITIEPQTSDTRRPIFNLHRGSIFYQSRQPSPQTQFRTRLASGALRGTEFHLEVDDQGVTTLTLIDGEVALENPHGTLTLHNSEQAVVEPGKPPLKRPLLNAVRLIQWVLYYPAVLDPQELQLDSREHELLAASLLAYRSGNLVRALEQYPPNRTPSSDRERIFLGALWLSVGQTTETEQLLNSIPSSTPNNSPSPSTPLGDSDRIQRLAQALRRLIQAVSADPDSTAANASTAPLQPVLATEWLAESYLRQSQFRLPDALDAARKACSIAPHLGFAWARKAELEFSFGNLKAAQADARKALQLAPAHAQAIALDAFILAGNNHTAAAITQFNHAIATDGALAQAWLGRGLCKIKNGSLAAGLLDLEMATALEPQRGLLRSYMAKALAQNNQFNLAEKELASALRLDPNDPTAWLYSALIHQQQNLVNQAIRDLEHSQALNQNRQIYRSRLLLDQDRAVRSANLASLYQDAGLSETSLHEAAKAVQSDYANFSAHLFLAHSYNELRDPRQVNLRYETPWLNEFLLAILLGPVSGATLSQQVSQQEYSKLFERDKLGLSSRTSYSSGGDWSQAGSQFGTFANTSYSLDGLYRTENGQRLNESLELSTFSAKIKQQLAPADTLFLQTILYNFESGDLSQYYDLNRAHPKLRIIERQEPIFLAGYHHQWHPGSHSLFLFSRFDDTLDVQDPDQAVLLLARSPAGALTHAAQTTAPLTYTSHFDAFSTELQQIFQAQKHTFVAGARAQFGAFNTDSQLNASTPSPLRNASGTTALAFSSAPIPQSASTDFERLALYAYDHWQIAEPLRLTAGFAYDSLTFPLNYRNPPILTAGDTRDAFSPKAGLIWTPASHTIVRAAFTRSLGGVSYDQSFRLEPTHVGGFNQAYRSLIPESIAGSIAAQSFETWGLGLDQKLAPTTFFGFETEWLNSKANRQIGTIELSNFILFPPSATATPAGTNQNLHYDEQSASVWLNQLAGRYLAFGARYRLTHAQLESQFTDIPQTVIAAQAAPQEAYLHQTSFSTRFYLPSGWFGTFESIWYQQSNQQYTPDQPGDDFWHFNLFAGYRFWKRAAELKLGLLNLTDQNYQLNPLNHYRELRRNRTFVVSLQFTF